MLPLVLKPAELQTPFFQNNPLPCLLLRAHTGHIVMVNTAAATFFRTTTAVLESASFFDLIQTPQYTNPYELLKKCSSQPLTLSCKTGNKISSVQAYGSRVIAEETMVAMLLVPDTTHTPAVENEQLLAAMVNETSDVLTAADLEFKPITWSKAAEQLYGVTPEQAIGKNMRTYFDIQYHNISAEEVRYLARTAGSWRGEMSFVRPTDAKKITLLITFKLIYDRAGQPLHYVISGTDITEQKETEARLRETEKKLQQSEAFYRTLISDSVSGKLLTTPDGTITFASPSIQTLLGFGADELIHRNAFEFVHPDDHPIALAAFQNELQQAPKVKSIEVRILRKDSTWLWCSVRGHNLLSNPNIGSMVISMQDDTQRKQAIDALQESEQRFRALIKDVKLGVTLQDAEGKILMGNKAAADLFGVDERALEGVNLYGLFKKLVQEDETPFTHEDWPAWRAAQTKKPVADVVVGICRNSCERTWLLVNANPVLDEGGNIRHIISSFTDVTSHKKLAQHLLEERLNQQRLLTQATIDGQERERKEIGKELHDNIGQQLATTKLYIDLAKTDIASDKINMLDRATHSIMEIINEIRAISHSLVPPTLGDLGLIESVHDLVSTIHLLQHVQIQVKHEGFCEVGLPENGKLMLYRIIQEALNNIVKHARATVVQIALQHTDGKVMLQIQDNGQGFTPEKIRRGLGLNNIRNRAEIFGGTVVIHAAPNAGCTIQVVIPDSFQLITI